LAFVRDTKRFLESDDEGCMSIARAAKSAEYSPSTLFELMWYRILSDMVTPESDRNKLNIAEGKNETTDEISPLRHIVVYVGVSHVTSQLPFDLSRGPSCPLFEVTREIRPH
jgi:hypothetical protein